MYSNLQTRGGVKLPQKVFAEQMEHLLVEPRAALSLCQKKAFAQVSNPPHWKQLLAPMHALTSTAASGYVTAGMCRSVCVKMYIITVQRSEATFDLIPVIQLLEMLSR